jgi:hypothetical protein
VETAVIVGRIPIMIDLVSRTLATPELLTSSSRWLRGDVPEIRIGRP